MGTLQTVVKEFEGFLRISSDLQKMEQWKYEKLDIDQQKRVDNIKKNWEMIDAVLPKSMAKSQLRYADDDVKISDAVLFSGLFPKYNHGGSLDIFKKETRLEFLLAKDSRLKSFINRLVKENPTLKKEDYIKHYKAKVIPNRDNYLLLEEDFALGCIYDMACNNTSTSMINDYCKANPLLEYYPGLDKKNRIVVMPDDKIIDNFFTKTTLAVEFLAAIDEMNKRLKAKMPLMVGVDRKFGVDGANPGSSTDHFIVIVGQGKDASGCYFTYYDPGHPKNAQITKVDNKLYIGIGNDGEQNVSAISTIHKGQDKEYTISEVRLGDKK